MSRPSVNIPVSNSEGQVWARRLAILIAVFRNFPQSFQENADIAPSIKPKSSPFV